MPHRGWDGLGTFKLPKVEHVQPVVHKPGTQYTDVAEILGGKPYLPPATKTVLDRIFILQHATLSMLYNFAQSGHPGGSISASRAIIGAFLVDRTAYDIRHPWNRDADIFSMAAGHKAMGWYSLNALLNEAVRQARPELLSSDPNSSMRLEDLLGFRKNPSVVTPLRKKFDSKCLDGHATPATPFTLLSTGASGVGVASTAGLAIAARDTYRTMPPRVYCFEGEGGMTPGRVEETLQIVERAQLGNFIMVVDHNDASIDSSKVCAGDYTHVRPEERGLIHGFNVAVADGRNFDQVAAAFDYAQENFQESRPGMIVFRTEKGEGYGFGTNKSHGAGHKMDSDAYFAVQKIYCDTFGVTLPKLPEGANAAAIEENFWQSLLTVRAVLQKDTAMRDFITTHVAGAGERLVRLTEQRKKSAVENPHPTADLSAVYRLDPGSPPAVLRPKTGDKMALRDALSRTLGEINRVSSGGVFIAAADLYGSLDLSKGIDYVPVDSTHLDGRVLATGITEDALSGVLAGISTYGRHIGAGGSYAAFMTPMGFTSARLHAIAHEVAGRATSPLILICGHAGPKTGEDGPTHADPQGLSPWLSFPRNSIITLTPWDNLELWPLVIAALRANPRPAVIVPFVTRPPEAVVDRAQLGIAPVTDSVKGVYTIMAPKPGKVDAYVVLQGSAVMHELISNAGKILRDIQSSEFNIGLVYVTSPELFDALPESERSKIWNEDMAQNAIGVTDFTMDTMMRWVSSESGRRASLHPFKGGHFLGSGIGIHVLKQAGLAGEEIKTAVLNFAKQNRK